MANFTGTAGADTLDGTSSDDQIDGLGGDDTLRGLAGDDDIDGGAGNDTISGNDGFDILRGGADDDIISDDRGGGEVYGGDGADFIQLWFHYQSGNTLLADGGNDNDTIFIGTMTEGAVTVIGGAGSDRIGLAHFEDVVEISLGTSRDIIEFLDGFFGPQIDNFIMSALTVTDFAAGNSGDVFDWDTFLGLSLLTWDQTANPFGAGFVRLVQSGADTLVQLDLDGAESDYGWGTFITLENVSKAALTTTNFDGYNPNGANVAGTTITGTSSPDDLIGTMGADEIEGGGGGDFIRGSGGSDRIEGGDGGDSINGEVGHDIIAGQAGDDSISAGTGDDEVTGGTGNDFLNGEGGDDEMIGGVGNDSLWGAQGDDVLIGGDGDDLLTDGEGSNQLDAGAGNDTIHIASAYPDSNVALGGSGNDLFQIYAPVAESVIADGGSGDDRFEVSGANGTLALTLGDGDDSLALFGSYNAYSGGGVLVGDFVAGPWGENVDWTDFLTSNLIGWNGTSNPFSAGFLRLVQSGDSTLLEIDADGHDFTHGFETLVTFEDLLATDLTVENIGWNLTPVKNGTGDHNTIYGTSAAERINGLGGNDRLFGRGGQDLLVGDAGNDTLDGGTGQDRHYGGAGNDIFIVDNQGDRVFEREQEGLDLVRSQVGFTLSANVENLILEGAAAISGTGNAGDNAITGNAAANLLKGGYGDDVLNGGAGADTMEGGGDDDLYFVNVAGDQVVELAGRGNDGVSSAISYVLPDHVEQLTLTGGADNDATGNDLANLITGNDGNNRIDGGAGADTLAGGKGHDTYVVNNAGDQVVEEGSSGNDTVESSVSYGLSVHVEKLVLTGSFGIDGRGNAGANTLTGNGGGNFLNGGRGNDAIDGGAGNDQLMGNLGQDALTGGAGEDRFYFNVAAGAADADDILDFSAADDSLWLLNSAFSQAGANGALAASAFHQGSAAADADDRILYDAATGQIFYDADGTGAAAAQLFATVDAGTPLTNADFMIYG